MSLQIMKNSKYRDSRGERIWFPSDGKPYFDKALGVKFNSIKEKQEYMNKNNLAMDGSSDKLNRNRIPEAGDTRFKKVK